jgi:hypothetical protein
MKELLCQWFEQSSPFEGILACGLQFPDLSSIVKTWGEGFEEPAVEQALRYVVDGLQLLQVGRGNPARVRWVYTNALLHCERRADGSCLVVFTGRNLEAVDLDGLERFFSEFQSLAQSAAL